MPQPQQKTTNSRDLEAEMFRSPGVAHAPIVNDNPATFDWLIGLLQKHRQVFLDARNSVNYVSDVKVTQKAFDEAAEIGLSSEAQRVLYWRKASLLYILMLSNPCWVFKQHLYISKMLIYTTH